MPKTLISSDLLEIGMALHLQGNYQEAEKIYSEALNSNPNNFNALQLLGALLAQDRRFNRAADTLAKALEIEPNNPAVNFNHGNVMTAINRHDEAIKSYARAIEIQPGCADYYFYSGAAMQKIGKNKEAISQYEKAIALNINYTDAYFNCGIALQEIKRAQEAITYYQSAIAIRPNYAQAYFSCGTAFQIMVRFEEALACYQQAIELQPFYVEALVKRGDVLQNLGRINEAIVSYEIAIEHEPANAEAFCNFGVALQRMAQIEESLEFYEQAIRLSQGYAEAYSNRGNALKELNRYDEAIESYNKAIELNESYIEAYCNRANVLLELNLVEDALQNYERAIEIDLKYPEANWGIAYIFLLQGKYEKGWALYESRWDREAMRTHKKKFKQPAWSGSQDIQGKTILLYAEQGLGDTIQFFRYAKLVKALGANVIIEVPKEVVGLLTSDECHYQIIEKGQLLPFFHYHCALMSLPLAFKTDVNTIPSTEGYLCSDATKRKKWAKKLHAKTKLRVGLVWSGSNIGQNGRHRSMKLEELIPHLPNCYQYICLQKEIRDHDKKTLENNSIISFEDQIYDFTDTAALCDLMDVVISIDTSVAHLSAAMGKKTWILLPYAADWRWLLKRSDSPWYKSVKLYRQDAPKQWITQLQRVKEDLDDLAVNFRERVNDYLQ